MRRTKSTDASTQGEEGAEEREESPAFDSGSDGGQL